MDVLQSHKMVKHKAKGKDLNSDKVPFFLAPKSAKEATGRRQESESQATEQCKRGATG